jgi:hypothetical protein
MIPLSWSFRVQPVLSRPLTSAVQRFPLVEALRTAERIAVVFFVYLAILGYLRQLSLARCAYLTVIPIAICVLGRIESARSRPWSRVTRDWIGLGLILAAYWSLEWFAAPPLAHWQEAWLSWDRALLGPLGLRRALESAGPAIPFVLEAVYLCLYLIPPIALGLIYAYGSRPQIHRFLAVLLLGAFAVYALLPLFPSVSPRVAYPGADLPSVITPPRVVNTWVLDHLDISTSVFPSGHVAVAFSSAFGLLAAFPRRRTIWAGAFFVAGLVYLATIHGRYHYAVDGLASIAIAAVCDVARRLGRRDET